jgi:hypothetical protein
MLQPQFAPSFVPSFVPAYVPVTTIPVTTVPVTTVSVMVPGTQFFFAPPFAGSTIIFRGSGF